MKNNEEKITILNFIQNVKIIIDTYEFNSQYREYIENKFINAGFVISNEKPDMVVVIGKKEFFYMECNKENYDVDLIFVNISNIPKLDMLIRALYKNELEIIKYPVLKVVITRMYDMPIIKKCINEFSFTTNNPRGFYFEEYINGFLYQKPYASGIKISTNVGSQNDTEGKGIPIIMDSKDLLLRIIHQDEFPNYYYAPLICTNYKMTLGNNKDHYGVRLSYDWCVEEMNLTEILSLETKYSGEYFNELSLSE